MLQIPGATGYIGSIGKDKFGEEMKRNSKLAGVNVSIRTSSTPCLWISYFLNFLLIQVIVITNIKRYNIMKMNLLQRAHVLFVLSVVRGELIVSHALRYFFLLEVETCNNSFVLYVPWSYLLLGKTFQFIIIQKQVVMKRKKVG